MQWAAHVQCYFVWSLVVFLLGGHTINASQSHKRSASFTQTEVECSVKMLQILEAERLEWLSYGGPGGVINAANRYQQQRYYASCFLCEPLTAAFREAVQNLPGDIVEYYWRHHRLPTGLILPYPSFIKPIRQLPCIQELEKKVVDAVLIGR